MKNKNKNNCPKVIARKQYDTSRLFLKMAQTKPLDSRQYSQLQNCIRLLRKSSSPKPTNPTYVRGLKNLFIDFNAFQSKCIKDYSNNFKK